MDAREPAYDFYVMREAVPKKYKRALYKTETGSYQAGHQYLSPDSDRFEKAVRECSEAEGVEPFDWVRFLIDFRWPIKGVVKGKVVYPKAGRPDASNVQKCVEDALQRRKRPHALQNRRKECLDRIAQGESDPSIKVDYWMERLEKVEIEINLFDAMRDVGAAVLNDRDTHDIHTRLLWVAPEEQKCVRVRIWEALPEQYYTKGLQEWLNEELKKHYKAVR